MHATVFSAEPKSIIILQVQGHQFIRSIVLYSFKLRVMRSSCVELMLTMVAKCCKVNSIILLHVWVGNIYIITCEREHESENMNKNVSVKQEQGENNNDRNVIKSIYT